MEGYICIGLVELILKLCASIMNNFLRSSVTLHNSLHGFMQGRGVGKATLEANLSPKLAGLLHETLFQVLLDLLSSCESLERGGYVGIIRDCGLWPNIRRLLQRFWNEQAAVPKARRYYVHLFLTERGVTQGDPVYPTVFNILVESVVRVVLLEVFIPQEEHHGLGWVVG